MFDAKLALVFVLGALLGASAQRWWGEGDEAARPGAEPGSQPPAQREGRDVPPDSPQILDLPPPIIYPSPPEMVGDPCDGCIAAAQAGNIGSAANHARSCTDGAKKAQCTKIVKSRAPDAAQAAAFNGQCGAARAIAAAAEGMGAGTSKLKAAIKVCK